MKVKSLNLGEVKTLRWNDRHIQTAIDKRSTNDLVFFNRTGVAGDNIADPNHHGGEFKAVLLYDLADYEFWSVELGTANLKFGKFGENITTDGIDSRTVKVGDRFKIGSVELQAVGPRVPCFKLNAQFQRSDMLQTFKKARRPGFYCRVLTAGAVKTGDTITLTKAGDADVSILDIFDAYHGPRTAIDKSRFLEVEVIDPAWESFLNG